jgi:hypothetical protein
MSSRNQNLTDERLAYAAGFNPRTIARYRARGFRGRTVEELKWWHERNVLPQRGGRERARRVAEPERPGLELPPPIAWTDCRALAAEHYLQQTIEMIGELLTGLADGSIDDDQATVEDTGEKIPGRLATITSVLQREIPRLQSQLKRASSMKPGGQRQ